MIRTRHAANLEAMSFATSYRAALCALVRDKLDLDHAEGRIIDFGAGQGEYAQDLQQVGRAQILCIEPNATLHRHYPHSLLRHTDLAFLPPRWASGAYSLNVFEHIADDVSVMQVLQAHTQHGGRILLLVPANPLLWTAMDAAVGHVRRYTPERLRALATAAGLRVREEGWFDRTGYFATRLLQLLTHLGLHSPEWHGRVSPLQIRLFDWGFRLLEPLFTKLNPNFGKNRWILLQVPDMSEE